MAFRSLLILTGSGMVLFEKEWLKPNAGESEASDYNRWGALLRTIAEFSTQATGHPVSFMEFPTVAITITADPKTKLLCAVFHEADARELAKLVTFEVLRSWKQTFGQKEVSASLYNVSTYAAFATKLIDAFSNTVTAIVHKLSLVRGILCALLVYEESTDPIVCGALDDEISAVANFQAMMSIANQTLSITADVANFFSIDMPHKIIFVHRLASGKASLVAVCNKSVPRMDYYPKIASSVHLLDRVQAFITNYK